MIATSRYNAVQSEPLSLKACDRHANPGYPIRSITSLEVSRKQKLHRYPSRALSGHSTSLGTHAKRVVLLTQTRPMGQPVRTADQARDG